MCKLIALLSVCSRCTVLHQPRLRIHPTTASVGTQAGVAMAFRRWQQIFHHQRAQPVDG
jgi:hypothetical protein